MKRFLRIALLGTALLALAMVLALAVSPANAETGKKALILSTTVSGGASSPEANRAKALGFTVDLVDEATWRTMTAAQFADYQLVVLGDHCSSLPRVVSENATALADAVMGRAGGNTKAGNRLLIGTDPVTHYGDDTNGGKKLVDVGIDFAGVQEGATGLYLDFQCNDPDYDGNGIPDGQDKLLPKLTVATSNWTQNTGPPCGGSVSLISNSAQFSTLRSSHLQGWGCSVHESFPTFPTDWTALAVATDTPTKPTCGTDVDSGATACGQAYILIAGSGIVAEAPNLSLSPLTDTNPVGTTHTVTATVTNPDGSPATGVHVSFVVTGANAEAAGTCVPASCDSDSAGHVTFTYTGTSAGDDTINASFTASGSTQTATAAKTWVVAAKPTIKITGVRVSEGKPARLKVTLSSASAETVGVDVETHEQTATGSEEGEPGDYVEKKERVEFAPGEVTKTFVVETIADEDEEEPDETFEVTLSNPSNATIDESNGSAVATITEEEVDEEAEADLAVTASPSAPTVLAGGNVHYVLSVSNAGPDAADATLTATLSGSAAVVKAPASQGSCSGAPIVLCSLGSLGAGQTATVAIEVNMRAAGTSGVTARVSSEVLDPDEANNVASTNVQVTLPALSINDVSVAEGGGTAAFTVRLLEPGNLPVTVRFTTRDRSARAPADYTATSGSVTLAARQLSKTVTVPVIADRMDEYDETFVVGLSSPTNATVRHDTGTGTITDDDPPPTVSVVGVTVDEGDPEAYAMALVSNTFAIFTLQLSEPSGKVVKIDYATEDGTARNGVDYQATSGTATFQPGETTQTVAVPVNSNNEDEFDRSFFLRLGSGSNATVAQGEAQGTIQDDDPPPPPVAGESGNGSVKSGTILIKLPGTDIFVPLTGPVQLPIGTTVDARGGVLTLQMSDGAGGTYTGEFSAGIFTILEQTKGVVRTVAGADAKPKKKAPKKKKAKKQQTVLFTTLRLDGGDFSVCSGSRRLAAKEKPKPVRRLWGESKGKFRTKGRHSAATVRGTRWLTSDRCDGTLTYVAQGGPVSVADFRLGRTIQLREGQTYVAKARGRR